MDLQTALKLQQLRKEHGFSQEELADQLGVSRQAVSKWERAEASPDTDNLICLAKLYKVSLDELLQIETDQSLASKRNDTNNGASIVVTTSEEQLQQPSQVDNIQNNAVAKDDDEDDDDGDEPSSAIGKVISAIVPLFVVISYIIMGFACDLWHPGWIVFLLIPILCSIVVAIEKKRFCAFAYPVLCTAVFLWLGCCYDLFYIAWVAFLTIPVYYPIFSLVDKAIDKKRNNK